MAVEFSLALPPGFREQPVLPPQPAPARSGFGSFGKHRHALMLRKQHFQTLVGSLGVAQHN